VTLSAPPRPPRPGAPVDPDELEALVQALIEEARQRARRRRLVYAAVATAAVLVGVTLFAVFDRTAHSQSAAPGGAARPGASAGAARAQIAFMRDTFGQGHKELYVMNADGSGQRLLARETGLGDMAWSPDGREIAFLRATLKVKVPSPTNVAACLGCWHEAFYAVKADGSGERRLTRDAAAYGFDWARNGKIAFTRVRGGYRDIWVMNPDGSGQRRLAQRGLQPRWSADGRRITFVSRRDGNDEVYVMNADGTGQRRLTHSKVQDDSPSWSPDGQLISFSTFHDGALPGIRRPLRDERRRHRSAEIG
jgi:dipeptidyl aminopeptidase/acylaminoacyl peptidase